MQNRPCQSRARLCSAQQAQPKIWPLPNRPPIIKEAHLLNLFSPCPCITCQFAKIGQHFHEKWLGEKMPQADSLRCISLFLVSRYSLSVEHLGDHPYECSTTSMTANLVLAWPSFPRIINRTDLPVFASMTIFRERMFRCSF